MFLFAVSIFLSAFLLFQIQPLIGKFILPWFGGTSTIWSTVMLFFQVLLTGGYAYAYWLIQRLGVKRQIILHTSLITFALLLLILCSIVWDSPVTPDSGWKPQDVSTPVLDIFRLLVISVGLPYFILAANGPLMQAWFSRRFSERSYARLYALSNLGSLLGLLSYPVLVEPIISLHWQGWLWALGFILFGLIAIRIAFQSSRAPDRSPSDINMALSADKPRPSLSFRLLWISLSATASLFLLSVTNQITQEVAVIPFLWVLPLALYLLSFIVTFSGERGYHRKLFVIVFIFSAMLTLFAMLNATRLHIYWQVLAYCLLLFATCMLCHGELYLLRPAAEHLTTFYLMVSIGGALGGIFVNLIAPLIFNGYWEFFVGLALTIAIVLTILRDFPRAAKSRFSSGERSGAKTTPALAGGARERINNPSSTQGDLPSRARFIIITFCLVTVMLGILSSSVSGAVFSERNFYGIIRVQQQVPPGSTERAYVMSHGITVHGLQFIAADLRTLPTTYYVPNGGAGLAILHHPVYERGAPMHVGLLGAGVGTLVAYGRPGDRYRLYEINPVVVELAQGRGDYFSFLSDSQADIKVVLGDARISLERERAEGNLQSFDVIVLDTFSSDSIPVHLVTKEAFALYLAHLTQDGLIAAHITNLHLDLQPVFWQLAKEYGLSFMRIDYPGDSNGGFASHWILLSRDSAVLQNPALREHAVDLGGYSTEVQLWTDHYSNLFQILK